MQNTCAEVADLIEPWAAGELEPPPDAVMHVSGCATCSARLARAREIDVALDQRPLTTAPPGFTSNVLRLARQERWHADSTVGSWWDLPLAASAMSIALGVLLLADCSGTVTRSIEVLLSALQDFWLDVGRTAVTVPPYVYVTATLLLVVMLMLSESDEELV